MATTDTAFVHGPARAPYADDAVAEPLVLSTTFLRGADGSYPAQGYSYARDANPNRSELEARMALLEGGVDAAAFASGMAAAVAPFQTLTPGDHVVVAEDSYYGVRETLRTHFTGWGLRVSLVDASDLDALAGALEERTRLVFVESPSNPMLRVCDLTAIAALAHRVGALLICDNTLATPVFQRPLALGADLVVHATTKYVSGHSDTQGGVIVCAERTPRWEAVRSLQKALGAIPSPFTCWLSSRGLATLPVRMRQQSASALRLAELLSAHPAVERVLHPLLPDNPERALALRQMSGAGAVFSFCVRGEERDAMRVAAAVTLFQRATSFGGPESLIEHRASVEAPGTKTPRTLLRLAIGLEDVDDLWADLRNALETNG
ncbi:MAG TPA: aminotransferase class I/II-fold pyridoxal phosphate-dependent enzyme [Candidatus Sulfotelmatobacter sp.]|nr:aminotransferase class I/II-fold pyridoxal phosphate-dependent enzyme [Candidatus Sulfotelmatobacter sp.]